MRITGACEGKGTGSGGTKGEMREGSYSGDVQVLSFALDIVKVLLNGDGCEFSMMVAS